MNTTNKNSTILYQTKDEQANFSLNDVISSATKRNWTRLNTTNSKARCSARANKKMSDKHIVPKESFDDVKNIQCVENLVNDIKAAKYDIKVAIFSLGLNLMNKFDVAEDNINFIKSEYKFEIINELLQKNLPNESDLLGVVYQCLQTEGKKNINGSYYTPKKVVSEMLADICLSDCDKILDPCCGSSSFLLSIPRIKPEQIFGVDIDPIAVMISRINFYLKFPQTIIRAKIYEADFLENQNLLNSRSDNYKSDIDENEFDYIVTNPPWGGTNTKNHFSCDDILSQELFSLFVVKSFKCLKNSGEMRFLLPCSILNVKSHQDIRKYLLEKTNLREIKLQPGSFSGVMTQYISMKTSKNAEKTETFNIIDGNKNIEIVKKMISEKNYYIINSINSIDKQIIDSVMQKKKYEVANATWALGIVTGDNKNKLFNELRDGFEPIYTGKDITPFRLKNAQKFVRYDRKNFQQVADDKIYRAEKKLVYKFISKKLVFSIDDSQSLFLNSANIVIPKIPNMSIYSVAAFLNSELYQYLYRKMSGEIKILKSSLIALPFMEITQAQNRELSEKVEKVLKTECDDYSDLHKYIYNLFEIGKKQIEHIKGELYGIAA